jgi:hypothetical protein
MRNQQQAEREEQQRIKNLVLNYDLRENEELDGDTLLSSLNLGSNIHSSNPTGHDKPPYHSNRSDKLNRERGGQRVRRLQLSDVDWYARTHKTDNNNSRDLRHGLETKVALPSDARGGEDSKFSRSHQSMFGKRQKSTKFKRHSRN